MMRTPFTCAVVALMLLLSANSLFAADNKDGGAMTFDKLPLQQFAMLFYDQCEKRGLVFDPAVSKLEDVVTIKTPALSCVQMKALVLDTMARFGVGVESRSGYDVLRLVRGRDERDEWKEFIYRPRFRDAVELAELSMIVVRKGSYAHQRKGVQVQVVSGAAQVPETGANGASLTGKPIDKLVFFGPADEVALVESLMSRVDVPNLQVEISVGVYEFQSSAAIGSAVNAAVSLFKSKIGLTLSGGTSVGSTLKLNLPSIDSALSLLDQDSRFRYVARPKILAKDGEQVTFSSGQDVRVPGSVSIDRNGNPVQNIVTMNAGVTMQATPFIRGDVVDLMLHQVVSDFVASPNNDPSVVKRDLSTRLLLQPGFVYVVGGLQTSRKTQSKQRFFGIDVGNKSDSSETEIILLLSVMPDVTREGATVGWSERPDFRVRK